MNGKFLFKKCSLALAVLASTPTMAENMLVNGDFSSWDWGWYSYINEAASADLIFGGQHLDGRVNITNGGNESWHIQMNQAGLTVEQGKTYEVFLMLKPTANLQAAPLA